MCHHGPGPGGLPPGTVGPGAVGGPGGAGPGPGGPGMGTLVHGPSQLSLHGPPLPPPPLCNPCSNTNSFNSVPLPGPSRWGPRTSCPNTSAKRFDLLRTSVPEHWVRATSFLSTPAPERKSVRQKETWIKFCSDTATLVTSGMRAA
uniref:Uncharacterized protein n=1 Tax=Anopheles dirus TaxID=7168 RepID=A0A182NRX5_9DIPT